MSQNCSAEFEQDIQCKCATSLDEFIQYRWGNPINYSEIYKIWSEYSMKTNVFSDAF